VFENFEQQLYYSTTNTFLFSPIFSGKFNLTAVFILMHPVFFYCISHFGFTVASTTMHNCVKRVAYLTAFFQSRIVFATLLQSAVLRLYGLKPHIPDQDMY